MAINFLVHALAALIPMIIGMIWYNPKVFGRAWMDASGMTDEKIRTGNMGLIYGMSLVLSFILTFFYQFAISHTGQFMAIFRGTEQHGMGLSMDSETAQTLIPMIADYHERFSSFSHGAFHGVFACIIFLLPVFATNAMFERKSFKYIMVNWCYWLVTVTLMMGVIGQFSNVDIQTFLDGAAN